jgi:hypothetical protein
MNKKDVIMLIEEWIKSPPGSRPLLEKAITEQYRKALTSQLEGFTHDSVSQWIRDNLCGAGGIELADEDSLDNLIAELLDNEALGAEQLDESLPMAAFKPSALHKKECGDNATPDDKEIASRVKKILDELR